MAISKKESNFKNLRVNVNYNKNNKDYFGSHYFKTNDERVTFSNLIINKDLNFDAGISQINYNWKNIHFTKVDELFIKEKNIEISRKILSYNLKKYCSSDLKCRLSVYNTGYKKSEIGSKYRESVISLSKDF